MPDVKLQLLMDDIKRLLKQHDVAGMVLLSSETHMEYLREYSPTWSCVRIEKLPGDEWGIRIKAKRADYPSAEAHTKVLADSVGMIFGFIDALEGELNVLKELRQMVGASMKVEHMTKDENSGKRCERCGLLLAPGDVCAVCSQADTSETKTAQVKTCAVCGTELEPGEEVCAVCGSTPDVTSGA